jgi:uncharacterized protein (TIGR00251 family)
VTLSLALRESDGALLLKVAARPGASRSAIQGVHGDALKVAIAAPPEKGKANKALVVFLAKRLGLKRSQVSLVAGPTSRDKTLRIEGVGANELRALLQDCLRT